MCVCVCLKKLLIHKTEEELKHAYADADLKHTERLTKLNAQLRKTEKELKHADADTDLKHAERLTKPNAQLRKRLAVQHLAQLKIEQEEEGAQLKEMQAQTAQVP